MCSRGCAKAILFTFNILFFICGALLLSFGIVGIANPTALTTFIGSIPGVDSMAVVINIPTVVQSSSVFMIVLGGVMLVFGFLGCAGAACDHHGLLFFYWFLLILVLVAEVALIIFVAVQPAMAEVQIQKIMYKSLSDRFEPVSINAQNKTVTLPSNVVAVAWVSMQFEVACCGAYNASDYSNFNWTTSFTIPTANGPTTVTDAKYPPSCCTLTGTKTVPQTTASFTDLDSCLHGISSFNTQGCYVAVNALARQYSYVPIIICSIVIGIEVVAIIAAIYLWRTKDEQKLKP